MAALGQFISSVLQNTFNGRVRHNFFVIFVIIFYVLAGAKRYI